MDREDTKPIGSVLQELLKTEKFSKKINETLLENSWGEVVGEQTALHTQKVYVKNRVLFVKVDSPALKSNLLMMLSQLKKNLNEKVGACVIDDIKLL